MLIISYIISFSQTPLKILRRMWYNVHKYRNKVNINIDLHLYSFIGDLSRRVSGNITDKHIK